MSRMQKAGSLERRPGTGDGRRGRERATEEAPGEAGLLLEVTGTELPGALCAGPVARTEIMRVKCPRAFPLTFSARVKRVAVRFQGLVKSDFTI